MGQSFTNLRKSKSKTSSALVSSTRAEAQQTTTKFPIPLESQRLREIKAQYQEDADGPPKTKAKEKGSPGLSINLEDVKRKSKLEAIQDAVAIMRAIDKEGLSENNLVGALYTKYIQGNEECGQGEGKSLWVPKTPVGLQITDMPILVVEKLLEYLSPSAILALRETCSATKGWIDSNAYLLRDFELKIELEQTALTRVCPPNTSPWSNFSIPYVQLQSTFIQDTIFNYCDLIWRLEIHSPKAILNNTIAAYSSVNTTCLFEIINQCSQLEHLSICRLDTLTCLGEKWQYEKLRVLSIDRLQWMNNSDFHMFENLLMKCHHLEYLKIPEYEILGSLAFNFYDVNVSPEKEYLVRPLIRYLDMYRNVNSEGGFVSRSRKLYIDVLEFEDFKLCSSEIFYELSRKCVECKAVLMNVYFVPRDAVLRNQQNIVEAFASMFGFIKIDFHAELWKNLEVMECWIEDYPDDLELIMRQLSFLRTISRIQTLRSLTIRLSIDDPDICSQTLEACVGEHYTGIQKLILRRHQASAESHVVIPEGFGSAFSNVKYLYFQELDSINQDFKGLWGGLPNLEELFMYKCPYLTQAGFLLPSDEESREPSVLKLTKLQVLVIFLYDGAGGYDDDFLTDALRHMRLRGFALRGATGVEFTEKGMMSLLGSPFHDTIEDFEAPSAFFRPSLSPNYWNFYIALPKKELRRNRIWLSCSVLLNSLSSRKHPYDFKKKCLGI